MIRGLGGTWGSLGGSGGQFLFFFNGFACFFDAFSCFCYCLKGRNRCRDALRQSHGSMGVDWYGFGLLGGVANNAVIPT